MGSGYSYHDQELGLSLSWSVGRRLDSRQSSSDRSRILTRKQDNILRRANLEDTFRSAYQLQATVISNLRADNLRSRMAVHKFYLTEEHAMDRLAFMISIDEVFDWGREIFSDETIVSTDYNGPARNRRELGRRCDPRYVHRSKMSGRISVKF